MTSTIDADVFAPITDRFESIEAQTSRTRYRVFDEWLKFVVSCLSRDDDTYRELVENLQHIVEDTATARDILTAYAEAFGLLVDTMEGAKFPETDAPPELLGAMYEAYGATSDSFGQHFTPERVALANAKMALPDAESIRDATPDDPFVIGDPACGSGRLPFYALHHLREITPETPVVAVARDIDATCARMATVNFALWGMPAYVVHGNSLTLETWQVWRVDTPTRLLAQPQRGVVMSIPPEEAPIRTNTDVEQPADESTQDTESTPPDGLAVDDAS